MSQEELTLEHIVAYLPHGLKAQMSLCFDQQTIVEIVGLSFDFVELSGIRDTVTGHFELSDIKPILRPLSDLTKEIEHNGEKFVPIAELLKIKHKGWYSEKLNTRYELIECQLNNNYAKAHFKFMASLSIDVWLRDVDNEPYWVLQKLFEWHFDVFSLIEKGLAVSIHDVG